MPFRPRGWRPGTVRSRRLESYYARRLREVAEAVGRIIAGYPAAAIIDTTALPDLQAQLNRYARMLTPWAEAVSANMLHQIDSRDLKAWGELSEAMSKSLQHEIREAPTGIVMRDLMKQQVGLIKSIPVDAGDRVHQWVIAGTADGRRAESIVAAIQGSEEIAAHRARTIARTEISRSASALLQARCLHIGSSQYIWRTVGDVDVRRSHAKLNGSVQSWAAPPICDTAPSGAQYRAHPGCIFNCRCWSDPIIPDID